MKLQLILLASFVCLALALPKAKEEVHKKISTIEKLVDQPSAAEVVPKKRSEEKHNHQAAPAKKVKTDAHHDVHVQKKRAASPNPIPKPIHHLKRKAVPKPIRPVSHGRPAAKRSPVRPSGGNKRHGKELPGPKDAKHLN